MGSHGFPADVLAAAAGHHRSNVALDQKAGRNVLQHLGDILADLAQTAAAARAGAVGRIEPDLLPRQVGRQRLAHRPALGRALAGRRGWCLVRRLALGPAGFQFLQLQFQLVGLGLEFLGASAELLRTHPAEAAYRIRVCAG